MLLESGNLVVCTAPEDPRVHSGINAYVHCCAVVVQAQHVLSEAKTRLEGSMLEGSTNDVVKGVTYIQVYLK